MIMGILTAILLLMFVGIVLWAWSRRRIDAFNEAAALPLAEDFAREPRA